jgi:hypothetical protein
VKKLIAFVAIAAVSLTLNLGCGDKGGTPTTKKMDGTGTGGGAPTTKAAGGESTEKK